MASKTTKKTESEIQEELIVTTDLEVTKEPKAETVKTAPAKKAAKKYSPNDLIECRSVTGGELILIGDKSKLQYTWADYADTA